VGSGRPAQPSISIVVPSTRRPTPTDPSTPVIADTSSAANAPRSVE
jgi:hypothetical protein